MKEPILLVQKCDCGKEDCGDIVIAILNPQIKRTEEDGDPVAVAYFPKKGISSLILYLQNYQPEEEEEPDAQRRVV